MDYKKKSLKKLNQNRDYEEIDTRLASGWYVDSFGKKNKIKKLTKRLKKDKTLTQEERWEIEDEIEELSK